MSLGRILQPKQMRELAGISQATEWRLNERGEGPPRVQFTKRRYGYPENLFNEWLENRLVKPRKPSLEPAE